MTKVKSKLISVAKDVFYDPETGEIVNNNKAVKRSPKVCYYMLLDTEDNSIWVYQDRSSNSTDWFTCREAVVLSNYQKEYTGVGTVKVKVDRIAAIPLFINRCLKGSIYCEIPGVLPPTALLKPGESFKPSGVLGEDYTILNLGTMQCITR